MTTTPNIKIESVTLDSLTLDPQNARLHGEENLDAIRNSLSRFGQVKPLVVMADGTVIAGNGTLDAARSLGWKKIDIVRIPDDWDRARAMAYAIADNRTAELAEWDNDVLASQLVDLDAAGWDLNVIGFPNIPLRPDDDDEAGGGGSGQSDLSDPDDGVLRCPKCGYTWQEVKS